MKNLTYLFLLFALPLFLAGQSTHIENGKILVRNKLNNKTFSMYKKEPSLKDFDKLLSVDTLTDGYYSGKKEKNDAILDTDLAIKYSFQNIRVYLNENGYISTFSTSSKDIVVEYEKLFTLTVGDHLDKISTLFPKEVGSAEVIKRDNSQEKVLRVILPFYSVDPQTKNYFMEFRKFVLYYDPETKILVEIKSLTTS